MTKHKIKRNLRGEFSRSIRNFPDINKKRYFYIMSLCHIGEEWRIRTNYLKLNKGFNKSGESLLISKLKIREYAKLRILIKGNMRRQYKYKVSRIDRLMREIG
jgi:hypothetical protein